MSTTWILVANSSAATLYETHKARLFQANSHAQAELKVIKEFSHHESRMKNADLVTDRAGHIEEISPKAEEADRFARTLAEALNEARNAHLCDDMIIVANPGFQGLIRQHLDQHLSRMISSSIEKDYTHLSIRDLAHQLQEKI